MRPVIERHIITGEYPPQIGGVADYTALVATSLAATGERVHVWAPGSSGDSIEAGVNVHRVFGTFGSQHLRRVDSALDEYRAPRRLWVQWVPHAFGRRSLNMQFCRWLRRRVTVHGDQLEALVHEPFLGMRGGIRHRGAAAVQRVMARVALGRASRILVTTPAWEERLKRHAPGAEFRWAPVPSGIPVAVEPDVRNRVRQQLGLTAAAHVIGTFGSTGAAHSRAIAAVLDRTSGNTTVLLIGMRSIELRHSVSALRPASAQRLIATGAIDAAQVSACLLASDVMVQPYPDGICGRHSSAAAILAHGIPMVSTSGSFTEALWRNSSAARLVPVGDTAQLASATAALLEARAERGAMSAAARALYAERFDVSHTVSILQARV